MPMSLFSMPSPIAMDNKDDAEYYCTCGECPETKISKGTKTRIMFGALQAMSDLCSEAERLEPGTIIDDIDLRCTYPYNWIPPQVGELRREALAGAHNILLVIYIMLQEGKLPYAQAIREKCEKEEERLQFTRDYIECGGSVVHILVELTSQVEADLRGEACYIDSDDLVETLEQIRPCALDCNLHYWKMALGID
ncbi:hypothetical protein GGI25_005421 [Coemansia spiralis]|uniref:Uncharacterized protein n=2 Tax=Coemansia TaxID=4863 RepID=A0A9W8KUP0_9FUNG|nr:hypothetical protein BX070DRAFT_236071 [Coemansia spiralis]KAJ1988248.1 hypothetical protein EDC05_005388 [Coemansia umbellata]KAJ2619611.1 hypothetical protein GGI26_005718 [Coemansia sp. RSA 1358]KAJ2671604.1 hypothetical protein GGI25_005421 [Coemansia spiralis]